MNAYQQFKKNVCQRELILKESIQRLEEQSLVDPAQTGRWREALSRVGSSLEDQLLRIAVVGSVKSGKSTLVNALLQRDLLKRGAGITTAFITRIQSHPEYGGWADLKPWGQIHDELGRALMMLPFLTDEVQGTEEMDLRRPEDRDRLRELWGRMRREWQQQRGALDPCFMVLGSLLEGYPSVQGMIGEDVVRRVFDAHSIAEHQRWVGTESSAVYVQDVELHVPIPWLGDHIEIADCQGSDSPNPLHLGQVQQYLLGSHFILYVINSRMGLRESDFKLIELVGTLRMTPQTLFVLNVDLDAHTSAADIDRAAERVREELSWVVAHPRLHVFSALYHLLQSQGAGFTAIERSRMDGWSRDASLNTFTHECFASFRRDLVRRVCEQRARLLCATGLSRLSMVAASLVDSLTLQRQFLDRDVEHLERSVADLRSRQRDLQDTLETLTSAINGLADSLAQDLDRAVDAYFDPEEGPLLREILEMVEHFPLEGRYERELSDPRILVKSLHRFYVSFRQAVSRHLVERTNGRIITFAGAQEGALAARFRSASRSFWSLYSRALDEYRSEAERHGIPLSTPTGPGDVEWSAPRYLIPPTFGALPEREAVSRSILLMKFGLGRLSSLLAELKGRVGSSCHGGAGEVRGREGFEDAVALVKSETSAELILAFRLYHQAFKRDYLRPLLEQGIHDLLEAFQCRAVVARFDFGQLMERSQREGENRLRKLASLAQARESARKLLEELEELTCAVHLDWLPAEGQANPGGWGPSNPVHAR